MRPYWHLDAKWLSALAAALLIVAATVCYALYRLTDHDTVTSVITAAALDQVEDEFDAAEFERVKQEAVANPDAQYAVPGTEIAFTGAEIAQLTPRQALELVFNRVGDTLYYEGTDAAEALFAQANEAPAGEAGGNADEGIGSFGIGAFSVFSEDTHKLLRLPAYGFSLAALAAALAAALFSRGFGRLGSPGLALLSGVAPAALAAVYLRGALVSERDEGGDLAGATEALLPTVSDLERLFLVFAAIGAVLVAVAVVGHISLLVWRPFRPSPIPLPEGESQGEGAPAISGRDELPSIGPGGVPQA